MTVFRHDYKPYPYTIPTVDLSFDLAPDVSVVTSRFEVRLAQTHEPGTPLILDADDIDLVSLLVDGEPWPDTKITLSEKGLTILGLPEQAIIQIVSKNCPANNSSLMGLYVSGTGLFTQCEAEGFRRITFFADRPDVMSVYRVTLRADESLFPTLLSNGNLVAQRRLSDGRHECVWQDPFPKPAYLFAIVAGNFDCRELKTETISGRPITLQIYSDPGTYEQTEWAMESLVRALRWDESRFGLELDLDRFMVVVARDFNMGAMENKGLNIFNAAYVLADPQTTTDANYQAIEAVVGHEYFHNWTGNRVTCRDWFQLSLKEGLTVFRDQEFTADMLATGLDALLANSARAVKRIDDVAVLRAAQFPEDAGPMAHPIRPESYQEIGNFYTATVYEKGAEVIRMMHTLLGEDAFQCGMKEYFRRYDGQAVTCDDFVAAMEFAWQQNKPDVSLDIFKRWYSQAGTPTVKIALTHEADDRAILSLSQTCEAVGVEKESGLTKLPFHIPLRIGAIGGDGSAREIQANGQWGLSHLIEITTQTTEVEISGLRSGDVLSLNRGFSAPVHIDFDYDNEALAKLAHHDTDSFAQWEALQTLFTRHMLRQGDLNGQIPSLSLLAGVCRDILHDKELDRAYVARLLSLPSEKYLLQQMSPMDPRALSQTRHALEASLGIELEDILVALIDKLKPLPNYEPSANDAGQRALRNHAIGWLCQAGLSAGQSLAHDQYVAANNMTDRLGALKALLLLPHRDASVDAALDTFYTTFKANPLVVDKWFSLQATAPNVSVDTIRSLMQHEAFNARNPNRLRALVFQFCLNNPMGFHRADGAGYQFWAEQVKATDQANPEVAARLARTLDHWAHHAEPYKSCMREALVSVSEAANLSGNTKEIISKALTL